MSEKIIPTLAGLIVLFMLGWYVDSLAHDEIAQAIGLTAYGVSFAVIAVLLVGLVAFVLIVIERIKEARAKRKLVERDADVYALVSETHGVFVREMNAHATWLPLHNNPAWRINGKPINPSQEELSAWQTFTLRNRQLSQMPMAMLPAMTNPAIDLLEQLNSVQRCLIVGASDAGKTTLLQWIISRRLNNSRVIVIDPHAYPDKWPNCVVVGTGRNYAEIGKALNALIQLMTKRYDEIGKGLVAEMAHNRLTIIIDEWRAIIYNVKDASEAIKTLLTESRKAAFSVFVGTHSERVKALGIEGEGDLKDGFAVVRLALVNGERQATIDTGNGELPAKLPGPYIGSSPQMIDADDFISLEPEPSEQEQKILELHDAGESFNEIARKVFGNTGGKQTQAIREVLAKFNQN